MELKISSARRDINMEIPQQVSMEQTLGQKGLNRAEAS